MPITHNKQQRTGFLCAIVAQRFPQAKAHAIATLVCKARQFAARAERLDDRICNGLEENDKGKDRLRAAADTLAAEFWAAGMSNVSFWIGAGASIILPGPPGDGQCGGWWL